LCLDQRKPEWSVVEVDLANDHESAEDEQDVEDQQRQIDAHSPPFQRGGKRLDHAPYDRTPCDRRIHRDAPDPT
jgi:hypothetical protein